MKIYRYYTTPPKFSLDDEELIELIRYISPYIGDNLRCCYPTTEYEIRDMSNLRFISERRILKRGIVIYTRIPFHKDLEVYFRHNGATGRPRFIVNKNGSYVLYELKFYCLPSFLDGTRLIGEI